MVMEPKSHLLFFFRALFQLVLVLCAQLPTKYQVKVDRAKFMEAFEARIGDDVFRPDSWDLGPDGNIHNPDPTQVQKRQEIQEAALLDLYELHAKPVPTARNTAPLRLRRQGPAPTTTVIKGSKARKRKAAQLDGPSSASEPAPKRMSYHRDFGSLRLMNTQVKPAVNLN